MSFKKSETEDYLSTLNQLNGTTVVDLRESFKGIFFATLAENRIAFGTRDHPGYLLESLEEMQQFMLNEGLIRKHIDLRNLIEYEGIQRFFSK